VFHSDNIKACSTQALPSDERKEGLSNHPMKWPSLVLDIKSDLHSLCSFYKSNLSSLPICQRHRRPPGCIAWRLEPELAVELLGNSSPKSPLEPSSITGQIWRTYSHLKVSEPATTVSKHSQTHDNCEVQNGNGSEIHNISLLNGRLGLALQ